VSDPNGTKINKRPSCLIPISEGNETDEGVILIILSQSGIDENLGSKQMLQPVCPESAARTASRAAAERPTGFASARRTNARLRSGCCTSGTQPMRRLCFRGYEGPPILYSVGVTGYGHRDIIIAEVEPYHKSGLPTQPPMGSKGSGENHGCSWNKEEEMALVTDTDPTHLPFLAPC